MLKSYTFHFILCSFIFFISNVQARELLLPRFSANASTGVYTVGQADLMISLDGDRQHNLYVNPQGAYGSDQQWYGDVGLGYRWIKNEAAILGWYLFAGHTRVENSSGFWITNPGLEVMGRRWDARINAYIPVAWRSKELGIKEFGIVNTPVFSGHTEILNSVFNDANAIQQVGNGADARVGYQLFRTVPLKGYLGAYFFDIANADKVRGGAAGMEYWFDDNIRVFANYSYDNYQHSHVVGGVGISFGGVRKHWADPSLSERLMDPLERYLANLGHGSGIPSKTLLYGIGSGSRSVLVSDSIAFFSQTGTPNTGGAGLTLANCTFESPCGPTDFSQTGVDTLNTLLPNTDFYFNGGAYPAAANVNTPLTLNNGQSIFSRTADYSAPATGTARSTFSGAFNLLGNNTLDGVILVNTAVSDIGINVSGASNVLISNSLIGGLNTSYDTGINIENGSVTLENSIINFDNEGIELDNASLLMQSSVINGNGDIVPTGIDAINGSNVEINDSQINMVRLANNIGTTGVLSQDGSVAINRSDIDVTNNEPTSTTEGLLTLGGGSINMNSGTLSVSDGVSTTLTSGPNINLTNVVCIVNGTMVVCP